MKALRQGLAPNPEYDAVRNSLYIVLKAAARQGESQSILLAKIVEKAKQGIEPLFAEVQRSELQVIQGMVEYLRKDA